MKQQTRYVLGFHPSSRGFGYALFENEQTPFDWGCIDADGDKNASALARLRKLLDKYRPAVLAMETFDDPESRRKSQVRALCRAVVALAKSRKIAVHLHSRVKIGAALGQTGVRSREVIAAAVADMAPMLRPQLPKHRRAWESERSAMAMFCAAACALADYRTRQK